MSWKEVNNVHWLEIARKVVNDKQAYKHDDVWLDLTTASMLIQVHEALGEENRKSFEDCSLIKAARIGWKLCR